MSSPPGSPGALAVAVVLLLAVAVIVAVDRAQPRGGEAPSRERPPGAGGAEARPKLPRTNVQTETINAFTASLPETIAAGVVSTEKQAPAFELRASRGTAIAIRLRDALGLVGTPEVDPDGVIVADTASDRVLRVVFAPGSPWMMYRGDPACLRTAEAGVSPDGRIFCATELGRSGSDRLLAARTVTAEEARSIAEEAMSRLGLEARNLIVSDSGDPGPGLGGATWGVTVETAVGGFSVIGLDTRLSVAENGRVVSGFGMVAQPELVGTYPLIDAPAAQARLLESLRESGHRSPVESRRGVGPAPEPTTIVGARLALALGEPPVKPGMRREFSYLVPTLVLDASDGAVFPVPAVTAEHLAD